MRSSAGPAASADSHRDLYEEWRRELDAVIAEDRRPSSRFVLGIRYAVGLLVAARRIADEFGDARDSTAGSRRVYAAVGAGVSAEVACLSVLCWGAGRTAELAARSDHVVSRATNRYQHAAALVTRFNALFNLNNMTDCLAAAQPPARAVYEVGVPVLVARYETVAALLAYQQGDRTECLGRFQRAEHALDGGTTPPTARAKAWHSLALCYSYVDIHGPASAAMAQAREFQKRDGGVDPCDSVRTGCRAAIQ